MRRLALALLALIPLGGCRRAPERPRLLVFAAASTSDALQPLGRAFEAQHGVSVDFSFAGSSTLARQLEAGAPADLFLSADLDQLEKARAAGAIAQSEPLLHNRLVVVALASSQATLGSGCALADFARVAMADPASVPAGVYARRWLTGQRCWAQVEPKVIPALDVRAALAQVESGAAQAGVVYATDAAIAPSLKVLYTPPAEQVPEVVYPLALTRHGAQQEAARAFYAFLSSPEATAAFARLGFSPVKR